MDNNIIEYLKKQANAVGFTGKQANGCTSIGLDFLNKFISKNVNHQSREATS